MTIIRIVDGVLYAAPDVIVVRGIFDCKNLFHYVMAHVVSKVFGKTSLKPTICAVKSSA